MDINYSNMKNLLDHLEYQVKDLKAAFSYKNNSLIEANKLRFQSDIECAEQDLGELRDIFIQNKLWN